MGFLDSLGSLFQREAGKAVKQGVTQMVNGAQQAVFSNQKTFTFSRLPETLQEMQALPEAALKDPAAVAALTVIALNVYPKNREECFKMMDFLRGPEPLTGVDKQMINDRFMDGRNYLMLSYFKGAAPANNYTPAQPFTIEIKENPYSRDNYAQGYLKLFLKSGGADSERYVVLRTKPSTGQWFINQFAGILSGIRIPTSEDKWA